VRGESEDEVVGFARTMRERAIPLSAAGPWTLAVPAGDGAGPSTSPRSPRWSSPPAACRSPSTATVRPGILRQRRRPRGPGRPHRRARRDGAALPRRRGVGVSLRARFPRLHRHALGPARSWGCARSSTCSGR
jgi:hypothetical protein